jgi:hypothetical protein
MARLRHPHGLLLPALALALLVRLATGIQLFGIELAGIRQSAGTATATYSSAAGLTTGLPTGVTGVAMNPATGVIYLATVDSTMRASTVIAATPSGGSYTLTTIAGNYASSATNDGVGVAANFKELQSLAVDGSGNVYMTDVGAGSVRRLAPSGGSFTVTTVTTGLSTGFWNAVTATSAGVLYVTDAGSNKVYELVNSGGTWTRTLIAGGGLGTADGSGASAQFFFPQGIAVDEATGNVYVVDTLNKLIRLLTKSGSVWTSSTIAGSAASCCADGAPLPLRLFCGRQAHSDGLSFQAPARRRRSTTRWTRRGTPAAQRCTWLTATESRSVSSPTRADRAGLSRP